MLLTSNFTKLSSPTPMFNQLLSTFFKTLLLSTQLMSIVNGPIPAILNPRFYTNLMELIFSCIKRTLYSAFFTLYIKFSSCNSVSFPSLDLLVINHFLSSFSKILIFLFITQLTYSTTNRLVN